ncbi:glycerophosphoryl diester phosphodiesterase [Halobacillus karajensis]|uniref:Glycerophosphoryl diester phosphodiesterase n=1 Tax=Halobacillus karajensis TaxID=195088 RepID=A0A024P6J7_9BACI|nr:glycerophosphodiester phosphodiesterase [Halobacillus karajensis]CDQ17855.1 Glycerophosphoryl diester phosphodiesterase [Halobacillus karajensis]CDQ24261.1 Glycerophosphoryl diester phosphodiesterase [Halobacillus karajensis]CDQ29490.1 Glycerophosphoryl diester phosphodiesterase [Halobacillus karajensis]SEH62726.1 glycerophosphoryl diester phosphodiesterase [Halobacillus karajensis]
MKTLIYAHRGASKLAPENTMPAFELARAAGADGIETDVQLTKDQVPVLIHDENLRRTTNGTGFVQDYTYAQLRLLDAGSWFSSEFSDIYIVTLDEFLRWFRDQPMFLNIELKTNVIEYKNIERIVYESLKRYHVLERTVISSFNSDSLLRMKEINPSIQTAFLTSTKMRKLPQYARSIQCEALHVKHRLLDKKLVKRCRKEKLDLRIYTVNRPSMMKKCYSLGVSGIFTDVPHQAIEYRDLFRKRRNR